MSNLYKKFSWSNQKYLLVIRSLLLFCGGNLREWKNCNLEWTLKTIYSISSSNYRKSNKDVACIKQCENRNPSGASNNDVVSINRKFIHLVTLNNIFFLWYGIQSNQSNANRRSKI